MAKKKSKRVGRPPKASGKMDEHVHLKVTAEQKTFWQTVAQSKSPPVDLSQWIRWVCDAAADEQSRQR
jgi:hypothetical protein